MIHKTVKAATAPVLVRAARRLIAASPNSLFDWGHGMFKAQVQEATLYGEYGCGASTRWVLQHTQARVRAVDASRKWVDQVLGSVDEGERTRLDLGCVDLGEVGEWGRPLDYSRRARFRDYTDYLWTGSEKPDVVLIDGRFRVCAFLTCLLHAEKGTRLIFDDYINRPHYHSVEDFVAREESYGRQCLFIAPGIENLDRALLTAEIEAFRLVME